MKKINLFVMALGALMLIGCGGNSGNGQNGQDNSQNGDIQETTESVTEAQTGNTEASKEAIILKAWQDAAVENFRNEYDVAKEMLNDKFTYVMDEALEHNLDWSDYEEAFNQAMKTMDKYRDKTIGELSNARPYDVPEQENLYWSDLLGDMIGEHGSTRQPSAMMLDYLFKSLKDNAVFCTPPPATDTEVFDEDEVFAFLEKVFPNSLNDEDLPDRTAISTGRFREWCSLVCDYDPIYMTQDAYAYSVLPNPSFAAYKPYPNAYAVSWERHDEKEQVVNFVVVTKVDGQYMIDNILDVEGAHCFLLFDYSVKPESIWGD